METMTTTSYPLDGKAGTNIGKAMIDSSTQPNQRSFWFLFRIDPRQEGIGLNFRRSVSVTNGICVQATRDTASSKRSYPEHTADWMIGFEDLQLPRPIFLRALGRLYRLRRYLAAVHRANVDRGIHG
jgi:hypothetical protein